jgi:hypothetical protein
VKTDKASCSGTVSVAGVKPHNMLHKIQESFDQYDSSKSGGYQLFLKKV